MLLMCAGPWGLPVECGKPIGGQTIISFQSHAGNHSSCEFVSVVTRLSPHNSVSQPVFPSPGSLFSQSPLLRYSWNLGGMEGDLDVPFPRGLSAQSLTQHATAARWKGNFWHWVSIFFFFLIWWCWSSKPRSSRTSALPLSYAPGPIYFKWKILSLKQ